MAAGPKLEILDFCDTDLGLLCLRRRELVSSPGTVVTEVTLDNEFLMSSYHTASENALASLALDWHGGSAGLEVLVGGLGLGYTARAALDDKRVERVDVIEFLPQVIAWLANDLLPLAPSLKTDPRFRVVEGDIFRHLEGPPVRQHDVVLIDVDHSPEEVLAARNRSFYTSDGLARARDHLRDEGVLAVWSSAENETFSNSLRHVFSRVKVETVEWHNELIDEDQQDFLFLARR